MAKNNLVLIIGAGPSGLLMACELARYGIEFRIIDKKPGRVQTTNAAGVHTRTLELFDRIGIVDRFLSKGQRWEAFRLHLGTKPLGTLPFTGIDSFYKFSMLIPQSETERILNERLEELKGRVERPVELINFKQEGDKVISTVKHPDGSTETIESGWLIGCDGYQSTVRQISKIPFKGEDIPHEYLVADLHLETNLSNNDGDAYLGKIKILAVFPLGEDLYRVVANLEGKEIKTSISEEEVYSIVQERSRGMFKVKSIIWSSPFWIHSRIADYMRQGSIFIAGDAAHVHSPAGGQGMNTGLQDVQNLAWKLALVIKGLADPTLLESYNAERHPVIKEIVTKTESFTKLAISKNSFLIMLRNFVMTTVLKHCTSIKQKLAMRLTQLSIKYKNSPVINYHTNLGSKSPHPGERAPDVLIGGTSKRLFDYLRNTKHNLIIFTGYQPTENDLINIKEIYTWIKEKYSETIVPLIVGPAQFNGFENILFDEEHSIHSRYHIKKPSLCLIRPDNVIAFFNEDLNRSKLFNFLNLYFHKPS